MTERESRHSGARRAVWQLGQTQRQGRETLGHMAGSVSGEGDTERLATSSGCDLGMT